MDTFIAITLVRLINDLVLSQLHCDSDKIRANLVRELTPVTPTLNSGASSKIGRHFLVNVTQVNFPKVGPTLSSAKLRLCVALPCRLVIFFAQRECAPRSPRCPFGESSLPLQSSNNNSYSLRFVCRGFTDPIRLMKILDHARCG